MLWTTSEVTLKQHISLSFDWAEWLQRKRWSETTHLKTKKHTLTYPQKKPKTTPTFHSFQEHRWNILGWIELGSDSPVSILLHIYRRIWQNSAKKFNSGSNLPARPSAMDAQLLACKTQLRSQTHSLSFVLWRVLATDTTGHIIILFFLIHQRKKKKKIKAGLLE